MDEARENLLADADILIDYQKSDLTILALVGTAIAPLYVLRQILDTVTGLSERECQKHGIQVILADTVSLLDAGSESGPLSFEDWLCFLTCRDQRLTCVTNDGALIGQCREADIPVRRGLGLMVDLVAAGSLDKKKALRVAQVIHEENPYHINQQVLEAFKRALDEN